MTALVQKPRHGDEIAEKAGDSLIASTQMQNYLDEIEQKINDSLLGDSVELPSYTVATLPAVPAVTRPGLIFVSDETGGAVPAFSDGSSWRRVTDRVIVS